LDVVHCFILAINLILHCSLAYMTNTWTGNSWSSWLSCWQTDMYQRSNSRTSHMWNYCRRGPCIPCEPIFSVFIYVWSL